MRLLDLFCGAGGAAMGYHRAGFTEIVGIDIKPQPRYPFRFVQGDALMPPVRLEDFDAIHASPPCQQYSKNMRHLAGWQPMLIEPITRLLVESGLPWVIENVDGAPLATSSTLFGRHGAFVCGTALGLKVRRHRLFESNRPMTSANCQHRDYALNPHNVAGRARIYAEHGRLDPEKPWRTDMGVEWMARDEAREAIPPAFTEFIGRQLLAAVRED